MSYQLIFINDGLVSWIEIITIFVGYAMTEYTIEYMKNRHELELTHFVIMCLGILTLIKRGIWNCEPIQ